MKIQEKKFKVIYGNYFLYALDVNHLVDKISYKKKITNKMNKIKNNLLISFFFWIIIKSTSSQNFLLLK